MQMGKVFLFFPSPRYVCPQGGVHLRGWGRGQDLPRPLRILAARLGSTSINFISTLDPLSAIFSLQPNFVVFSISCLKNLYIYSCKTAFIKLLCLLSARGKGGFKALNTFFYVLPKAGDCFPRLLRASASIMCHILFIICPP